MARQLGPTDSLSNDTPRGIYETAALNADGGDGVVASQSGGITYSMLKQTRPGFDAWYACRLRSLYSGGRRLLGNEALMREVFPPHRDEADAVYKERVRRAFYMPYAGEIIDHIIAALTAEPLALAMDGNEREEDGTPIPPEPLPPFYEEFVEDCSPPGGARTSINQLIRDVVLDAMLVRTGWVLYDVEYAPTNDATSLAEEDAAGARDVYAVVIPDECVIDFEENGSGELTWAVLHTQESRRGGLAGTRDKITERWTYWTRTTWERYEVTYKRGEPPRDDDVVQRAAGGIHTHGKVPLRRFSVPDGLWAMEKLEGLAREHLNKRSALSWAEFQALFSELYEFHGSEVAAPEMPISDAQTVPNRATIQRRGQGYVQVRGKDDDARFIGPDTQPFTHALATCKELRDEMHRVMHQMALSVDNSAAALTRSGDSKAHDKAAQTVVLAYLGLMCREFLAGLVRDVALARAEPDVGDQFVVKGMENFEGMDTAEAVTDAVALEGVPIPSPTFQRRHKMALARAVLGANASPDDLLAIATELEENITSEEFDPAAIAEQEAAQQDHELKLATKAPAPGAAPPNGKPPGARP